MGTIHYFTAMQSVKLCKYCFEVNDPEQEICEGCGAKLVKDGYHIFARSVKSSG